MNAEDIDLIPIIRTENVEEEALNPTWEKIERKMQVVCDGDLTRLLKFTVKKHIVET